MKHSLVHPMFATVISQVEAKNMIMMIVQPKIFAELDVKFMEHNFTFFPKHSYKIYSLKRANVTCEFVMNGK